MVSGRTALAAAVVVLVAAAAFSAYGIFGRPGGAQTSSHSCTPLGGTSVVRSQVTTVAFGGVKEYSLPNPSRFSNGVAVAQDGSVWFGEESVPGVGHLFGNGTLVEYPWPTAGWTSEFGCGYRTGIWGIAFWNGMTWATDLDENALVGVQPQSGRATVVNVSSTAREPYTLAPAPDGSLWFTCLSAPKVGRLAPDLTLSIYGVTGTGGEVPAQIQFVNSSLGYFVGISESNPSGHLYSFDPRGATGSIAAHRVGATFGLLEPTSLSVSGSIVWITQHGASSIIGYDTASGNWTTYPTSTVGFAPTTLPYFVVQAGNLVWFNEHYANRVAVMNAGAGTLAEYSESNPPVGNGSLIQNDLTIAASPGGAWFTSTTGNYIGFVDGAFASPFTLSVAGQSSRSVDYAETVQVNFSLAGAWQSPLKVSVSDSESFNSVPSLIRIDPGQQTIPAGSGLVRILANVTAKTGLPPGEYTVALSVSDGLITQTAYFFLKVT